MSVILLDTNICIYVMNRRPLSILARFEQHINQLAISTITLAELRFGAANSARPEHNQQQVEFFCRHLDVLPFEAQAAAHYGDVRAFLKNKGQLIGDNDLLIAAHALALDALLITNNIGEFSRVPDLQVENWL